MNAFLVMVAITATAVMTYAWWREQQASRALENIRRALRSLAERDLEHLPELKSGGNPLVRDAFWQLWDVRELLLQLTLQVRELATRWKTVSTQMQEGLVLLDPYLRVLSINPAAARVLSVTERQALGRPLLELTRALDVEAAVRRVLEDDTPVTLEVAQSFPAERTLEVHITTLMREWPLPAGGDPEAAGAEGEPATADDGLPLPTLRNRRELLMVIRDTTRFRRLERMRADFVAAVSHELSTPLTSIRGFAETLLEGALADPETARRFVAIIGEESTRLSRLVDDLLELSRLESGRWQARLEPVDAVAMAQGALTRLQDALTRSGLTVALDLPEDLPLVMADPDQLSQVFLNLLDNSIKYTPRGGQVTVSARPGPHGEEVYITVRDTGAGIPTEHLSRVFERFYRVDKARSRASGGTGLGLSIVKHIVEGHGGQVWAESPGPDQGTGIIFTLRTAPEAAVQAN